MIGDFLHRFVCELGEERVARSGQPLQQHVLPGCIEQMPRDCLGKIAVGLLNQQAVPEIEHVAVKGELIPLAGLVQH
jgi:hypothetical protein